MSLEKNKSEIVNKTKTPRLWKTLSEVPNYDKLNAMEKRYFSIMFAQAGVLYIKGKPGFAKTAILRTIADKLEFNYIDLRLTQMDEINVGLYPYLERIDGEDFKTFDFAVPKWALKSNDQPTIICFEEFNRAGLAQRNASMQIMNEREIGSEFKFNGNVFMCATGNLGEEDGTDVDEIDAAQKGRVVTIKHELTIKEWIDGYAKKNVHNSIVRFIENKPIHFFKYDDDVDAYASPRTWSFFSAFLVASHGMDSSPKDIIESARNNAHAYVGASANAFIKYLDEIATVSLSDIIKRYPSVRKDVLGFSRPQVSDILVNLAEYDIEKLKQKEVDNVIAFIKDCSDDDEITSTFWKIVKKMDMMKLKKDETAYKNSRFLMKSFPDLLERIQSYH